MHSWLNFNGVFIKEDTAIVSASNRGLRYGDGLFETMRFTNGAVKFRNLHCKRLFAGLKTLKIQLPALVDEEMLIEQVTRTVEKNRIKGDARVRLMVFRGDGGLYEFDGAGGGYIIQVWSLPPAEFNENGLIMGVYNGGMKPCDALANIKSNNYLLYAMAAIHAKENKWNDAAVLNTYGRVCDATIANIFWVRNGRLFTPSLSEGCIAGVMREHLLANNSVAEVVCEISDLENADEVFVTNAIAGVRWVKEFQGTIYQNNISRELYAAGY